MNYEVRSRIAALAITIAISLVPLAAGAIGVSVTPAKAAITVAANETATIRLNVANPSKDVAIFEVYPDALEQLISVTPASFTLEAGAERFVEVSVRGEKEASMTADISVVARPLADNTFQQGTGIKVPVAITVTAQSIGVASVFDTLATSPWTGAVALAIIVGFAAYKLGGRKKKSSLAKN